MTKDGLLAERAFWRHLSGRCRSQSLAESETSVNWELALFVAQFVSLKMLLDETAYEVLPSRSSKKSADMSLLEQTQELGGHLLSHLLYGSYKRKS
jgi:hypothetical protein